MASYWAREQLRGGEVVAFKELWENGVTIDDIRRVIPRLKKVGERGIRLRARKAGLDFWRDGETPPDSSEVNEKLMRELLKQPRKV